MPPHITQGINNSIAINPGFPQASTNQTLFFKSVASITSGGNVYQVTAGKTLYLVGIMVCYNQGGTGGAFTLADSTGSKDILTGNLASTSSISMSGGVIASIPSAHQLIFSHQFGTDKGVINLWGYEQ